MRTRTLLVAAACAALLPFAPATAASAVSPTPSKAGHPCPGHPDGSQPVYKWVTAKSKRNVILHAARVFIPKHSTYGEAVELGTTNTVSATLSVGAEVHASAGVWLAKAETTVNTQLTVFGSKTKSTKITRTLNVTAKKKPRRVAFFEGTAFVKARWHYKNCNGRPTIMTDSGRLKSYSAPSLGAVECGHNRYRTGSMAYEAALAAGC